MDSISDLLRKPFHSKDLNFGDITKTQVEEELGIRGYFEHLNGLGWDSYQWSYFPDDYTISSGSENIRPVQFIEVFGSRYNGYIRGNSRESLLEACKSAVQQAQAFAECEAKMGHDYEPYKGYTNGLIACKNCGFNGFNSLVGVDKSYIRTLQTCLNVEKQMRNEMLIGMKEWGISLKFDGSFSIDQEVYSAKILEHKQNNG